MDTGVPLFFSKFQYLLLETIPLETIMRVMSKKDIYFGGDISKKQTVTMFKSVLRILVHNYDI